MSLKNMRGIKIIGVGSYSPPLRVTNDDLAKVLDTSDEWIYTRTGIKARHYNESGMNCKMAVKAAELALKDSGADPADIDYILVSTSTPDFIYPATSCIVQNTLGAANAACLDISAACTGFASGFDMARALLYSGYDRILLAASESLSFQIDFFDRTSSVLFGDGAGAVILERGEKLYASYFKAKGVSAEEPVLYYKVNYEPNVSLAPFANSEYGKYLNMDGKEVYKFAVEAMPEAVESVCEKAGLSLDEIDLFIPHQANIRIVQTAAKSLGIPMEKVYINIENHGNTSSACMPVCLDELKKAGRLKNGMKLCFAGFGAGLTYGAIITEI